MPDDFIMGQTFIFGSFKFIADGRGLLYDETPPSPIGTMHFESLKFHFNQHDDAMCLCAPPSPLARKATPVLDGLRTAGPPTRLLAECTHDLLGRRHAPTQKLTRSAIYATVSKSMEFLDWSDSTIIFDRTDHPTHVPQPGNFALVIDPIVDGFRLLRVLMDWGSGINVIFPDTLANMGISKSRMSLLSSGFHRFVPGRKAQPLGQVELEVIFGDEENFRSETLCFEVTSFYTGYKAILGRPAYMQFMALPSYAYLQLKMLGPNDTITVHGSTEKAIAAEVANVELAEAALASA